MLYLRVIATGTVNSPFLRAYLRHNTTSVQGRNLRRKPGCKGCGPTTGPEGARGLLERLSDLI